MKRLTVSLGMLVLAAMVLAACGAGAPAPLAGSVVDYGSLVDALQAAGAAIEPAGDVAQPFLSGQGRAIAVDGQAVQVFEYADAAAAETDAASVSPDGRSTTTTMITWVADPHFYRAGKLIVLYVGSDAGTLSLLEKVLGDPFAGA